MTAQMKPHPFNPFDPISVISLLEMFTLARNTNVVHKRTAMWLFHFFMSKTTFAGLAARLSADGTDEKYSRSASGKTRYFTNYLQEVYFLLKKYATYESIAETESVNMRFA